MKKRKSTDEVTKLIYLMILIFCIAICLLSFLIFETSSSIVTRQAEREAKHFSQKASVLIDSTIQKDIAVLENLVHTYSSSLNEKNTLVNQNKILTQFDLIFQVSVNGYLINKSKEENNFPVDFRNMKFYKQVLNEQKSSLFFISEKLLDNNSFVLAVPILSGGKLTGILAAITPANKIFEQLSHLKPSESTSTLVFDSEKNLLNQDIKTKENTPKQAWAAQDFQAIEKTYLQDKKDVFQFRKNEFEYLVGYQKLQMENWSIALATPMDVILKDAYQLRHNVMILTGAFLFFTLILTMLITYRAQKLHYSVEKNLVALRTIQTKLINSSKMSALGEMAGGIAHEINTPLGVITLRASQAKRLLAREPLDLDNVKTYIETIENVAKQIAKIVQGLRAFSGSGEKERSVITSVRSIFDNTLILCTERLKQREITLIDELQDKNLGFECKAIQISQVLLNLINNACDAVTPLEEKWIRISARETAGKIEISVMNSGPKIPAEIRDKIMQPFFTTKDIGQGTGLGLSLSKGIVEAHHGRLYLDIVSENTRFVAEIPTRPPERKKPTNENANSPNA